MKLQSVRNSYIAATCDPHSDQPLLQRAISRIRQTMCALHGHDLMLHFERGRMSLHCVTCGQDTPGWQVGPSQVIVRRPRPHRSAA